MPSPGSTAIFMSGLAEEPGELRFTVRFESADLVGVLQRGADFVQAVEERMAARSIDLEPVQLGAVGRGHRLALEVYDEAETRQRAVVEQAVHLGFAQRHRQEAVLEAVVEENVAKRRRDDALEAVLRERPGRMLARAAA